ncbi:acyl-CoA thioester hydrolase [Desulfacinum hydrothermale DSM 13146]|uniref:Acyl-CoA thioester hydrolase n=1 Tax=Desulfacinum hydrothermale DSM 13146 TaxID=1121390 RepID=A0A1W1XP61_9BACT|nr:thioesterase family protein [Desulfacinum hydrothermale]SMC25654.1 acyl-CoA thioester hydrolase [Desulfacinum hydrothermale DSM 13146]
MRELLEGFPVVIELPVVWGEMDAFQHVNNVVYFRYFETARIAYFLEMNYMKIMEETGIGPILAATQCRYRFPLTYPDTISVGARVPALQEDRFTMEYRIVSHRHKRIAAEGDALVVSYDYRKNAKTALPERVRHHILRVEGRER